MNKPKKEKKVSAESFPQKKKFVLGLVFLLIAFLGVIGVFYLLLSDFRQQSTQVDALKEQISVVNTEKTVVEQKSAELAQEVGKSVHVDQLLSESRKFYKGKDVESKEGYLWVDRSAEVWIATLGALNGVKPGSKFAVYQGADVVDTVVAQTPLDVISYVQPSDKLKSQFEKDYFRIVLEAGAEKPPAEQ